MTVIIIAGGEGKRWNNHLGIRKHFVKINGERIIDRIIRQFRDLTDEVILITKKGWEVEGVTNIDVEETPQVEHYSDANKIACTRPFWDLKDKTLILLGDVYFSDEAVEKIKRTDMRDWFQYGRLGRSIVKKRFNSNENFALSFYPEHHRLIMDSIQRSGELVKTGDIRHNKMAQIYRILCGKDGADADYNGMPQENLGHFVEICDYSDDVDRPQNLIDLVNYLKRRK